MKNEVKVYENASMRKTYVARVYDNGERITKERVLNSLKPEWSQMHRDGHIHIHDLDAYGLTYNCLTFDLLRHFPYHEYDGLSNTGKILKVFRYLKDLISKVGNEQSGGMGFANFDRDLATIIMNIGIDVDEGRDLIHEAMTDFILWCNDSHERMGQVSYYVTINIGICNDELSRSICEMVLDSFSKTSDDVIKPNIVFKVKKGYNHDTEDSGRYLLEKALLCSSRKMIPTFILCDCKSDRNLDPLKLSVMGCRTRVVDDVNGKIGSNGRGNIDNISINLPRLAMESVTTIVGEDVDDRYSEFKRRWVESASIAVDILMDRYSRMLQMDSTDFPTVSKYNLWCEDFDDTGSIEKVFRHGTHSIGFIGLSEAMEILTGQKYHLNEKVRSKALEFVSFMRDFTDRCTIEYGMNFSLLATSGEFISGRFPELDGERFDYGCIAKGYYTNSFHVDVDSGLTALEKIRIEGPFHEFCNGGCISYVEFDGAPLGNVEGLLELIDCAVSSGVHYIGFNYPLDICNECGGIGVFDNCPQCGSSSIKRIRRVSGYLEILDYFVKGKRNEVKHRSRN